MYSAQPVSRRFVPAPGSAATVPDLARLADPALAGVSTGQPRRGASCEGLVVDSLAAMSRCSGSCCVSRGCGWRWRGRSRRAPTLSKDPGLLAALWDIPDPMTAFADLARRHDFVLPLSRRLHDDVRDTLRADLLDPWRRPGVREMSQRALDLYRARLSEMRGSRTA